MRNLAGNLLILAVNRLNQRLLRTSRVLLAPPCSGGFFGFIGGFLGRNFFDARIFLVFTIVYSDRNCLSLSSILTCQLSRGTSSANDGRCVELVFAGSSVFSIMARLPSTSEPAHGYIRHNLVQILRIVRDIADFVRRYLLKRASTVGLKTLDRDHQAMQQRALKDLNRVGLPVDPALGLNAKVNVWIRNNCGNNEFENIDINIQNNIATLIMARPRQRNGHEVIFRRSFVNDVIDYLLSLKQDKVDEKYWNQFKKFQKKEWRKLYAKLLKKGATIDENIVSSIWLISGKVPNRAKESWLQFTVDISNEIKNQLITVDSLTAIAPVTNLEEEFRINANEHDYIWPEVTQFLSNDFHALAA